MISITDFDSEAACFDYCTANKGQWLEIPAGVYDVGNLTMPHQTNITGVGNRSVFDTTNGPLIMPNSQGGSIKEVTFHGGALSIRMMNCRSFLLERLKFENVETAITMEGSSYYNDINKCQFYKIPNGIITLSNQVNENYLTSSRFHTTDIHIKMNYPNSHWVVNHNSFEGTGGGDDTQGTGVIYLEGDAHHLLSNRYERSGANVWDPATIVLGPTTTNCVVDGGSRGYLFDVLDQGEGNMVINPELECTCRGNA